MYVCMYTYICRYKATGYVNTHLFFVGCFNFLFNFRTCDFLSSKVGHGKRTTSSNERRTKQELIARKQKNIIRPEQSRNKKNRKKTKEPKRTTSSNSKRTRPALIEPD